MKIVFDQLYQKMTTAEVREYISRLLHAGEVVVEFKKVNGDLREMPCTLKAELLPPQIIDESSLAKESKKVNDTILSVWCLDKQAWRSFRVDSVISISSVTGE